MTVLVEECPKVAAALDDLIDAIRSLPALDGRTRQLVNIGIQTATRNPRGVYFHAMMARNEGASRDEVIGAVVMNLHLAGLARSWIPLARRLTAMRLQEKRSEVLPENRWELHEKDCNNTAA